jgi:alpha-glucosidase
MPASKTVSPKASSETWPDGAIVYHIYPRSWQDASGDGVGDLPGIISRLDYLKDLGVEALWLSPFYPSPMIDFGYDVSDYCDVDPLFGTLDDFKELLHQAHKRHLRVLIDLVPNHTSDEHPWFKLSSTSRFNPKANWYIWKDAHPDSPPGRPLAPNNWRDALSGESAWQWSPEREQFYLHSFDRRQPDLNWTNPAVRDAIKQVMRFWLDMGVDGFRIDAGDWLAKDPLFRDDDRNPEYVDGEDRRYEALAHNNSRGWPTIYAHLSELAEVLKEDAYRTPHRFMVTEAYPPRHNPLASYVAFYEAIDPRAAAPFNFEGIFMHWRAGDWRRFLRAFHQALDGLASGCVSSYAFGNHDQVRIVSRLGDAAARSAALMQMTLPGLVFIYYGEEIGMHNVDIPPPYIRDPQARDNPHYSRDPERTPMQWTPGPNAGFSSARGTWLPIGQDYIERNVETEQKDPQSFLNLYRTLASLRNRSPALRRGQLQVLELGHPDVLGYVRAEEDEHYIMLINFSDKPVTIVPGVSLSRLLISSHPQSKLANGIKSKVELLPNEAALFV